MNFLRGDDSPVKQEFFAEESSLINSEGFELKALAPDDSNDIGFQSQFSRKEEFDVNDNFSEDIDNDPEVLTDRPTKASPDHTIDWPEQDLFELISRIEQAIPHDDNLVYSTRVEKLDWNEIKFKDNSGDDCKKTWLLIQKQLRQFRCLSEILQDAKEWVSKLKTDFHRHKKKDYPDKPSQPPSAYNLFFLDKKDTIFSENPGLDFTELSKKLSQLYKSAAPEEKAKYKRLAERERKKYAKNLYEFYRKRPKMPLQSDKPKGRKPRKPPTPFYLYCQEELKNSPGFDVSNNAFKEQCKEGWKKLPDEKKVVWINLALDMETKYQNPDYAPATCRTVLTKEEKALKDRLAGKPAKPPCSAYSLFSRVMLQSDEIKKIDHPKRLKFIADQWKSYTDEEKQPYVEEVGRLAKQYKQQLAVYLKSHPEQQDLYNRPAKRTNKESCKNEEVSKKKTKHEETTLVGCFENEPASPPLSGFLLYRIRYNGETPAKTAWKNLTKPERAQYENEVKQLKRKYIKEYEKFLRSLSKKQLLAFHELKQKSKQTAASSSQEEKSEASSSCDDSNSENEVSDSATDQE